MHTLFHSHKGFTLIELMISLVAASIVTAGIYGFYHVQQKSHVTQELVVEMQQNIRATMSLMKREIRMAGYNPAAENGIDDDLANGIDDPAESAGSGFVVAARDRVQFTSDLDADSAIDGPDSDEDVIYRFKSGDTDDDGIADSGSAPLGRDLNGPAVSVEMADDIQAVAFAYAYDDDGDGQLDLSAGGNIIWAFDANVDGTLDTVVDTNDDGQITTADAIGGTNFAALAPPLTPVSINSIKAVRVWLLGRTRSPVRDYRDNQTYVVGDRRVIPAGDSYQRRLLVETIHCRNMGL